MDGHHRENRLLKLGSSVVNSTTCEYGCVKTCLVGFLCQHKATYPASKGGGWNLGSCYNKEDQEETFGTASHDCEKHKSGYEICCLSTRKECSRCHKVCKVEGKFNCQDNFIPDSTTEETNVMVDLPLGASRQLILE